MVEAVKVPVIIREEYTVYFERYEGLTFGHCDVRRWSPQIAKRLQTEWDSLMDLHGEPVFAFHEIGDRKHLKWCLMFGFHYEMTIPCVDGQLREIYKCDKGE